MKKAAVLISALFLFAGLTFAQEPQKPVKKAEPAQTEQTTKSKSDCVKVKECSKAKTSSSCCKHGKPAAKPAKTDPGKK
ncbi:MAG: hypothetical protein ISS17_04580 [Bacteroidales bacterium]|nr:hypothetical protein [Deltaproteobacteria bacterium]MBL7138030.1 hypothetical protein [Bacteroidales bacterium]